METVYPPRGPKSPDGGGREDLLLPVGGATVVVLRGGPAPWQGKPAAHFTQVEVEDPDVARVTRVPAAELRAPPLTGSYTDVFAFRVTCLRQGKTSFQFTVGNTVSATNKYCHM